MSENKIIDIQIQKDMTIEDHINAVLRMFNKNKDEIIEKQIISFDNSDDQIACCLKFKDSFIAFYPQFRHFVAELIINRSHDKKEENLYLERHIIYKFNKHGALNFQEIIFPEELRKR